MMVLSAELIHKHSAYEHIEFVLRSHGHETGRVRINRTLYNIYFTICVESRLCKRVNVGFFVENVLMRF